MRDGERSGVRPLFALIFYTAAWFAVEQRAIRNASGWALPETYLDESFLEWKEKSSKLPAHEAATKRRQAMWQAEMYGYAFAAAVAGQPVRSHPHGQAWSACPSTRCRTHERPFLRLSSFAEVQGACALAGVSTIVRVDTMLYPGYSPQVCCR